ncbi:hypothetical protein HPB52_011829 [Rhipicephalus sanguineus]|uniref:EGF-like domain-containing protein n=1 Tax=Rhipicephalus sanguineus TaxID=34632 RepID=A0A9D4T5L9_RHISA|nr:hypothetical protein HPB52_011829 [Rhipicephalus sanguineus]
MRDLCEENINECLSSPCKNRGDCEDGIDSFTCHCTPGYGGPLCELRDTCTEEVQQTDKGTFHWQPVPHGSVAKVECPYGAYNPASEYKYARRKCRLLADGQTSWMKIAQAMIHVISNFLALNDSVIEEGDANGVAVEKLVSVVERFTSEVVLGPGALIIENENLVVKAVAWSPKLLSQGQDFLSFSLRSNGDHYLHEEFSGDVDDQDGEEPTEKVSVPFDTPYLNEKNIVITIPFEALSMAINSSLLAAGEAYRPIHEVEKGPRISFVSYRNDKFFRPHRYGPASLVSTGE